MTYTTTDMHYQEEALALNSVDSIKASNPELSSRGSSSSSGPPSKSGTGPQATTHRAAHASEPPSGPPSSEGAAGAGAGAAGAAAVPELEGCTLKGSGINWSVFYGNVLTAGKWLRSSDIISKTKSVFQQ